LILGTNWTRLVHVTSNLPNSYPILKDPFAPLVSEQGGTRRSALPARTFHLSQLPLAARALSQMPATMAGPSKRFGNLVPSARALLQISDPCPPVWGALKTSRA
jgi:hypothetical protein